MLNLIFFTLLQDHICAEKIDQDMLERAKIMSIQNTFSNASRPRPLQSKSTSHLRYTPLTWTNKVFPEFNIRSLIPTSQNASKGLPRDYQVLPSHIWLDEVTTELVFIHNISIEFLDQFKVNNPRAMSVLGPILVFSSIQLVESRPPLSVLDFSPLSNSYAFASRSIARFSWYETNMIKIL